MQRGTNLRLAIGSLGAAALAAAAWFLFLSPRSQTRIEQPAPGFFEDKTAGSGIDFTYRSGKEAEHLTILETLGGGIALIDYDQDGLLDIFVTGGGYFGPNREILGHPNRLYRNEGNWRFRDVTAEVGLPTEGLFYTHGAYAADYNRDGWPDLLLTGYGRMALFKNVKGRFVEVTKEAGLLDQRDPHWSTGAAWADVNGDGHLDLFVVHYVNWSFKNHIQCQNINRPEGKDTCSPRAYKPLQAALYLGNGDGTFREITNDAGLKAGNGLGVVALDINGDGKVDFYVGNDASPNHLYLNLGGGKFKEIGHLAGVALNEVGNPDGSMGVTAADYDGSGHPSLFVANFQNEAHALYRNLGNGFFKWNVPAAGLAALPRTYVGFGTSFVDFDRDGAEDLVISNGHVLRDPAPPSTVKQRPILLRNLFKPWEPSSSARFEVITDQGGPYFRQEHEGRGLAVGDLDNDGLVDLVISHCNEPITLLRNQTPAPGHWLGLLLESTTAANAAGAKIIVEVAGRKLTRFVLGGNSYLSSHDPRLVIGLGQHERVEQVTIHWPYGKTQTWAGAEFPIDCYVRLRENDAAVRRLNGGLH
jgi:enediyne biosynthesis protein E4